MMASFENAIKVKQDIEKLGPVEQLKVRDFLSDHSIAMASDHIGTSINLTCIPIEVMDLLKTKVYELQQVKNVALSDEQADNLFIERLEKKGGTYNNRGSALIRALAKIEKKKKYKKDKDDDEPPLGRTLKHSKRMIEIMKSLNRLRALNRPPRPSIPSKMSILYNRESDDDDTLAEAEPVHPEPEAEADEGEAGGDGDGEAEAEDVEAEDVDGEAEAEDGEGEADLQQEFDVGTANLDEYYA